MDPLLDEPIPFAGCLLSEADMAQLGASAEEDLFCQDKASCRNGMAAREAGALN